MLQTLKRRLKNQKGFTLIELIVVIAIIAILAAILIPRFSGFTDDARKEAVRSEAKNIIMAIETEHAKTGANAIKQTDIEKYTGALTGTLTFTTKTAGGDLDYSSGKFGFTYKRSGENFTATVTNGNSISVS